MENRSVQHCVPRGCVDHGEAMKETHILKTSVGVTVKGTLTDTGQWACLWSPKPPYKPAVRGQIVKEYLRWRDNVFADFAGRTGNRVLLITF